MTSTIAYPDFSPQGYQVQLELASNSIGGRVTYLATHLATGQPVALKQFQFARTHSAWSGFEACEAEIRALQVLDFPAIPRYLDSFETPTGFCWVQEYKPAQSLNTRQYWTPAEIKQIAIALLDILVYLQQQTPPVIHRDIKPENILVDRSNKPMNVYLVDFGFARLGCGDLAASSVVKGTLGFMPPEQMFNRQLAEASDLYSLGATLICLLTRTPSVKVGDLIDEATGRFQFQELLPHIHPKFIAWLEKTIAPKLSDRFPNAATALTALKAIPILGRNRSSLAARSPFSFINREVLVLGLGVLNLMAGAGLLFSRANLPREASIPVQPVPEVQR
jgi:serine/threonine protein kinase